MNDIERPTEDDLARKELGPQGVPGKPDVHQRPKSDDLPKTKSGDFDGHVA